MAREDLIARWFDLTRTAMPALSAARGWPVHADHCFQRILLDNAVGAPWRTRIEAPAWRNAPESVIEKAVALAERAISGDADLSALNRRSLALRGKLRASP